MKEEARGAPSGLGCTASAAKLSAEREEQGFSRDSLALERMFAPALGTSGRLTTELILRSPQYMNACSEYEIDLRGNKISAIENLGGTENQFDSIDLSDNEIVKLEGFPLLPKLKTLLLKRTCSIHEMLKFGDISVCSVFKQIENSKPNRVSNSLQNSIWTMKNYWTKLKIVKLLLCNKNSEGRTPCSLWFLVNKKRVLH